MATADRMIPSRGSQVFFHSNSDNLACFFDFSSDAWCVRNLVGFFTYANSAFLTMSNVQSTTQLVNKPLEVITTFGVEHIDNLIKIERQVIAMKKPIVIPIWGLSFYGYRNPIIDIKISPFFSDNNSLMGTYWHCSVHRFIPLKKVMRLECDKRFESPSPYDLFSIRQWTVIWLIFNGWGHSDISFLLDIEEKSSRQLLTRAYKKVGVSSFDELHQIIISHEWDAEVPIF